MTLSLYSTYKAWRQEDEAERIEAAARRVIQSNAPSGRHHSDIGEEDMLIGIG